MTSKKTKSDQVESNPSWTDQEKWVWQKVSAGEIANFNEAEGYGGEPDPKKPDEWLENRILTLKFLETILLYEPYKGALTRHGVQIVGAWFKEPLNLSNAILAHQLVLISSRFDSDVYLNYLKTPYSIILIGSKFYSKLDMTRAEVTGDLHMHNAEFADEVILLGAKIGGQLSMDDSRFLGELGMNQLQVKSSLLMRDKALFAKEVDLHTATIKGTLEMDGSKFNGTLNLGDIQIGRSLFMRNGAEFAGINLTGADIGGSLEMNGSKFSDKLDMGGMKVKGTLRMKNSEFADKVVLLSAKIGGLLSMEGSRFSGKLDMDKLQVESSLFMRNEVKFEKEVILRSAKIGGQLSMNNSQFSGELNMENLEVAGSLFMRDSLFESTIGAIFAKIDANLDISGSQLQSLDLTGTKIKGEFSLGSRSYPPARWKEGAKLILRNTEVGALQDLPESWPEIIELEGFKYSWLGGFATGEVHSMANREISWMKEWLERQQNYSPQPYEQLGKVLKEAGHKGKANEILYAGRERERSVSKRLRWFWLTVENLFIGYGYRLGNLLCWFLVLMACGMWVLKLQGQGSAHSLDYGFSYTLDMLLPLIRLNEAHYSIQLFGFPKYYFYFLKIAGYFLASLLIYGISEIARKSR